MATTPDNLYQEVKTELADFKGFLNTNVPVIKPAVQALRAAMRGYEVRGIPRVLLMAFVRDQANLGFDYLEEFVDGDPELKRLVTGRTRSSLTLAHGCH